MSPDQIQALTSLPLQALLLIAVITLWRAYNAAQNARIEDLKNNYQQNMNDLRTRVVLLEARMGLNDMSLHDSVVPGAKLT